MKPHLRLLIVVFILLSSLISPDLFAQDDEFKEFNETEEFDEFKEFEESCDSTICSITKTCDQNKNSFHSGYYFIVGALFFTIISGFFVKFQKTRKLRYIFLLTSLVILGFYRGGCPCMISGFHDFWFWILGQEVKLHKVLWFLGLIPLTYLFGRVWCGWVCHLGALQEFLHRSGKRKFVQSDSFQKGLKILQYVFFIILLIQILITRTNLFIHYDPFKVAFNLFSANLTGYLLLAILLVSSLFINRPFCRGICPVGLILGWISKIPGSLNINKNINCTNCHLCERNCPTHAIDSNLNFDASDCIACGNCFDSCKKDAVCCERNTIEKK